MEHSSIDFWFIDKFTNICNCWKICWQIFLSSNWKVLFFKHKFYVSLVFEKPSKFIIAKLLIHNLGSSWVLIYHYYWSELADQKVWNTFVENLWCFPLVNTIIYHINSKHHVTLSTTDPHITKHDIFQSNGLHWAVHSRTSFNMIRTTKRGWWQNDSPYSYSLFTYKLIN